MTNPNHIAAHERTAHEAQPLAEVTEVLQQYLDALYYSDADRMSQVFHNSGVYATADAEPVLIRDKPTYLAVLAQRESPATRGEPRRDHIDRVDFAGANTARAQVRCAISGTNFMDYLTLIRDAGRWQIIAKVFQMGAKGD
ncbi:MAG: nuclear transport factor 2 family protein [Pseudomonadota bacterium]